MKLFFYLINACNYAINYCNSPRETPSQKMTGTPRHLLQACPKGLGLTYQRHHITPTLPQTAFPPPPHTHTHTQKKPYPKTGTTPSITLHGPPADHLHTNSSHPTTTIDHQGNPRRHVNGSVATKHKHASFYCDLKNINKGNIINLQLNPHLFSRNSIISMMLSDNQSNGRAVCLLIWNYIFKASVSFKIPLFRVPSIFPVRYLSANCWTQFFSTAKWNLFHISFCIFCFAILTILSIACP